MPKEPFASPVLADLAQTDRIGAGRRKPWRRRKPGTLAAGGARRDKPSHFSSIAESPRPI